MISLINSMPQMSRVMNRTAHLALPTCPLLHDPNPALTRRGFLSPRPHPASPRRRGFLWVKEKSVTAHTLQLTGVS